jgi:hypothetical protein
MIDMRWLARRAQLLTRETVLHRALIDLSTADSLLRALGHEPSADARGRQFGHAVWLCHSASNGQEELRGRKLTRVGRKLRVELDASLEDTWRVVTATCYSQTMAA